MLKAPTDLSTSVDPPQKQLLLRPEEIRGMSAEEICQLANKRIMDARRNPVTGLLNGQALQPVYSEMVRQALRSPEVHGLLSNRIRWPSDLDKSAVRDGLPGELRCVEIDINGLNISNKDGGHDQGNELLAMAADFGRVCIEDSQSIYDDVRHPVDTRFLVHVSGDEFRMLARGSVRMIMAIWSTANAALETHPISPSLPSVPRSLAFAQSSLFEASAVWRELTHVYPALRAQHTEELVTRLIQMQKLIADLRMLWLKDRDRVERAVHILNQDIVTWGKISGLWLAKVDVNIDQIAELAQLPADRRSAYILEMITEEHLRRIIQKQEQVKTPPLGRRPRLGRLEVYSDDSILVSTSKGEGDPRMALFAGKAAMLQAPFTKERMVIKA